MATHTVTMTPTTSAIITSAGGNMPPAPALAPLANINPTACRASDLINLLPHQAPVQRPGLINTNYNPMPSAPPVTDMTPLHLRTTIQGPAATTAATKTPNWKQIKSSLTQMWQGNQAQPQSTQAPGGQP